MSDEPADDYFAAAAAVVAAARELDEARRGAQAATQNLWAAHARQKQAEDKLQTALEQLQHADTGRSEQA